jgi:hypothetical protein
MSFINYNETEESREANDALETAIENNDREMIDRLMSTKIDNRTLRPSVRCLSEAIFQRNEDLIVTLLSDPYRIEPNINCLNYAADRYTPKLFVYIIEAYPQLRDVIYWDTTPSISSAIQRCNIQLVRYLIENLHFPLSNDFFSYIEEEPQPEDPFSAHVRNRRNIAMIRYLRRQISIHGVDDDSEEEVEETPAPSCVRRLFE